MPNSTKTPRYHCGQPVNDTCPFCGETGLVAKFLAEEGLDTPPVGEAHHVEGLVQDASGEAEPAETPAGDPAPEPFPVKRVRKAKDA